MVPTNDILVVTILAAVGLVGLCGLCFRERGVPVPSRRTLWAEVRSDCRSWIAGNVRDVSRIRGLADLDAEDVGTLAGLGGRLNALGVDASPASLRWREIARRRGESPLLEIAVVRLFLEVVRDLARGER